MQSFGIGPDVFIFHPVGIIRSIIEFLYIALRIQLNPALFRTVRISRLRLKLESVHYAVIIIFRVVKFEAFHIHIVRQKCSCGIGSLLAVFRYLYGFVKIRTANLTFGICYPKSVAHMAIFHYIGKIDIFINYPVCTILNLRLSIHSCQALSQNTYRLFLFVVIAYSFKLFKFEAFIITNTKKIAGSINRFICCFYGFSCTACKSTRKQNGKHSRHNVCRDFFNTHFYSTPLLFL